MSPIERGEGANLEVPPTSGVPPITTKWKKKLKRLKLERVPLKQDRAVPGYGQTEMQV